MLQQCISNKVPTSSITSSNNVFDIQLSYDVNWALDPKEWDSDFYTTSLHRAMEHLVSDVKTLWKMEKYIQGKFIDNNPNNIKDLEGIRKAA